MWVTDASGNMDFCEVVVEVQANQDQCQNGIPLIAGAVESITGKKAVAKEVTCIGGLGHETCGFDITLTEKED